MIRTVILVIRMNILTGLFGRPDSNIFFGQNQTVNREETKAGQGEIRTAW